MTFATKLKAAINASDSEEVDGKAVRAYNYLDGRFDGRIRLELADDSEVTFDLQQEIEVSGTGHAGVIDEHGNRRRVYFAVSRPLCADDLEN